MTNCTILTLTLLSSVSLSLTKVGVCLVSGMASPIANRTITISVKTPVRHSKCQSLIF